MKHNPRKVLTTLALFAVPALGLWSATPPSAAPTTNANETVMLDPVIATGTRFGSAASQADVPVIIIGKQQMAQTPYVEMADYLKNMPAFTGSGNTNDSSTNGGNGGRNIDLRGLGSQYTLVLLNGRRLSYHATDNIIDVNQIPVSAVDHVEVLTSGASAIYGSDAIGGVVNVITKRGQNGGELDVYYGNTNFKNTGGRRNTSGLERRQFSFSVSGSEGKVDFLAGAQYFKQAGAYSSHYTWSFVPSATSNVYPYRLSLANNLFTPGATGSANYLVKWKPGEGGPRDASSPSDFRTYVGTARNLDNVDAGGDQFPFYLFTPIIRPEERYNVFAFTTYQLAPNVKLSVDMMYRYAYSYNQLAPAAVPVPGGGGIIIPSTNYWNQKIFGANAPRITSGGWRLLGLGPRLDTNELNSVWANVGLEGRVSDWNWRVESLFTQEMHQRKEGNSTSIPLLNERLALTTPDAFNPFSSKLDANTSIWSEIKRDAYTNDRSQLANISATVDGKVFDTANGAARGALSVEWNQLRAYSHPDALTQATPLGFNGTPFPTDGARTQYGASAEVETPILPQVTARFAARHDHYSDIGNSDVGQASVKYQPSRELLFRGSWGMGFIAPSILELHEGPQITNPSFVDPTSKTTKGAWGEQSQVSIIRRGNPDLKPEKARMIDVGVAYSPKSTKGLTLTADYWYVKQTDKVATPDDYARVVAKKFWDTLGSSDAARDAAARNPTSRAAAVATIKQQTGVDVRYDPNGGASGLGGLDVSDNAMVGVGRVNLAGQNTDGVDFGAVYSYNAAELGNYLLDVKAIWTRSFDHQAIAGEPFEHWAGMYSSGTQGVFPKWRYNVNLSWQKGKFGANATYHYLQRVTSDGGIDANYNRDYLPGFTTWDFLVSWRPRGDKVTFALGMENAFNQPPSQTSLALNNRVPIGAYDVKGRYWYARAQYKF